MIQPPDSPVYVNNNSSIYKITVNLSNLKIIRFSNYNKVNTPQIKLIVNVLHTIRFSKRNLHFRIIQGNSRVYSRRYFAEGVSKIISVFAKR